MAAPLELVSFDPTSNQFKVNTEAASVLRNIPGPVAVVAVCGRARQGKSFLLNRLINSLTGQDGKAGFQVSPYQRPCTKGLWIYSTPILMPQPGPDGRRYHLVLMDCEGIDAYDQSQQYSTQIFSLAVMLSSLFVYNQLGGIDESSLERLSLVSELTKRIWQKASTSPGSPEGQFSPSFLWLLRDFHLQVVDEGRQMTPKDYLEETLQPMSGGQAESRNQVRSSIKALFPERDCFALVRPLTDEQQLARMDTLPLSQLRPEFQEGLKQLVTNLKLRARPKQYAGVTATGPMLAGLATAFVDAINNGAVPVIASAWQGVVQGECYRAMEAATQKYQQSFNINVVAEENALDLEHQRALAAGMNVFQELSLGDREARAPFEAKYRDAANARFAELRGRRLAEADASISAFLADATAQISVLMRDPDALQPAKLAALQCEVTALLQKFDSVAKGPSKARRLQQFLQGVVLSGMEDLIRRSVAAHKAAEQQSKKLQEELRGKEQQVAALQQEARTSSSRVTRLESDLAAASKLSQDQSLQLQSTALEAATTASELAAAKATCTRLETELAAANSREASFKADLAKAAERFAVLTLELSEKSSSGQYTQQALQAAQADASRLREDLQAASQRADAAKLELASVRQELESQLQAARADAAQQREQLALGHQQQLRDSQRHADTAAELARLRADAAALKAEGHQQVVAAEQRGRAAGEAAGRAQLVEVESRSRQLEADLAAARAEAIRQLADKEAQLAQLRTEMQRVQVFQANSERQAGDLKQELARLQAKLQQAQDAGAEKEAGASGGDGMKRPAKRRRQDSPEASDMDVDAGTPAMPAPSAPPLPQAATGPSSAQPSSCAPNRSGRAGARAKQQAAATPPAPHASPSATPSSTGRAAVNSPMGAVAPDLPENVDGMKINDIKAWLTDSGFEDDVMALNAAKGTKRADWLRRIKERIQGQGTA